MCECNKKMFHNEEKECHDKKEECHDKEKECQDKERHVHEFLGSTMLAELKEDPHNHRFAGVSGPEIKVKCGHVHVIKTRTDFYEDHFHEIIATSGIQKDVGDGRHVHFVETMTTEPITTEAEDHHRHNLIFATLIEDPISEEE